MLIPHDLALHSQDRQTSQDRQNIGKYPPTVSPDTGLPLTHLYTGAVPPLTGLGAASVPAVPPTASAMTLSNILRIFVPCKCCPAAGYDWIR